MDVPPPYGAVVGVTREDAVIYHAQVVDVHDVAHEDVQFLQPSLRVHLIHSHPVVKTCYDQFSAYHLASVDRDLMPPHLVLVPEQHQFVFVPCHQD